MLTSLLEHNPYQGILTPTIYKEKLKELDTILSVYTQEKIEEEEKSICSIRIRWTVKKQHSFFERSFFYLSAQTLSFLFPSNPFSVS